MRKGLDKALKQADSKTYAPSRNTKAKDLVSRHQLDHINDIRGDKGNCSSNGSRQKRSPPFKDNPSLHKALEQCNSKTYAPSGNTKA